MPKLLTLILITLLSWSLLIGVILLGFTIADTIMMVYVPVLDSN